MHKKIEWLFLALSAAMVWLVNPPSIFDALLSLIGIPPSSYAGAMMEGLAVGVFLLVLQNAALFVFDQLILPLTSNYKGGTWIYSLLPKPNIEFVDARPTVGRFRIRIRQGRYVVEDGYAYWVTPQGLKGRGRWSSKIVCIADGRIDIIYRLDSEFRFQGEKATHYEGHIKLEQCSERRVVGRPHRGHFNDLEDRAHVRGPIYAERVSRFSSRVEALRETIESRATALLYKLETDG